MRAGCGSSAVCVHLERIALPRSRPFQELASSEAASVPLSPKAPGIFKPRPPVSVAPAGPLLPLHEEVEALLFLSEGKPYLLEVCTCSSEAVFLFHKYFLLFEEKHLLLLVIFCMLL